jgi:uncharacterized RDD family membrane protein YckC
MGGPQMSAARQASLTIQTPEGVTFSFELASPVARALAWSIDIATILALGQLCSKLASSVGHAGADWARAFALILYFLISIGYGILLEWRWRGQTLGKRALGLRVLDAHGLRLRFPQVVLRNLLRLIDMLPLVYLVGGVAALCSRHCQRLGDLAAGTVVARERVLRVPDLDLIAPAKYNSLAAYPHLAARLRSRCSPELAAIAVAAVSRRDELSVPARLALFADLAAHFRALVAFPDAACEALTPEQYVRSLLRVIYASGRKSA